jgi:hypothetical protein
MNPALALFLAGIGLAALWIGVSTRRPALILLAAAVLVSHAAPLAAPQTAATLAAYGDTVAMIGLLASLAWLLGYWLMAREAPDVPQLVTTTTAPRKFHFAVLALLAILLALAPGGIVGFAETGFLRLPVESLLFSVTYATACLAAFTTTMLCIAAAANRARAPYFSIAVVLLVFWLLGGRVQLVITALSFALAFLAHGRVRAGRLILPGLLVSGLAVLTLTFRLNLQGEAIDPLEAAGLMARQLSLLEGYALAARFVDDAGTQAAHYWQTAQQILPRAFFPDKPPQLSRALRFMEARDTLGGLTPGLGGEAFVSGGLIAVVAIGLAFGAALAALDNCWLRLATLSPLSQSLVACLLPLLAIFVIRGGFDTAIFRLDILVLAWLTGKALRRSKSVAAAGHPA